MYSKTVMDHFKNPRNVGEIQGADGVGEVGNPICGDMMKITIKVANDRIKDIKFLTFGCGAAIAVSSMVTEMAKGKTLDEAKQISKESVAKALDDLPKNKLHCSNLGADALQMAIKDYENRKIRKSQGTGYNRRLSLLYGRRKLQVPLLRFGNACRRENLCDVWSKNRD